MLQKKITHVSVGFLTALVPRFFFFLRYVSLAFKSSWESCHNSVFDYLPDVRQNRHLITSFLASARPCLCLLTNFLGVGGSIFHANTLLSA